MLDKHELIWKNIGNDLQIQLKKGQTKDGYTVKLPLKLEKYNSECL